MQAGLRRAPIVLSITLIFGEKHISSSEASGMLDGRTAKSVKAVGFFCSTKVSQRREK